MLFITIEKVNFFIYILVDKHELLCYNWTDMISFSTVFVKDHISDLYFISYISAKSYPTAYLSRATNFETKDMLAFVSFIKNTFTLFPT